MRAFCDFCFRHCSIEEGGYGWCKARTCIDGKAVDREYGYLSALADDPIEKKPLYHFLPGTRTLSLSMRGCSFDCDFCQNHEIAKDWKGKPRFFSPEEIVSIAAGYESISFTYTEPIVWQDYALSVAEKAKKKGIKTIMVTNGAFSSEALKRTDGLIDAFNIDLKGDEDFYRAAVHGDINPVLDSIGYLSDIAHLEVTTLVIESIHTLDMIKSLERMLYDRGVKVWHISAFYPQRFMSSFNPTTDLYIDYLIENLSLIPHVYPGNTGRRIQIRCPECGTTAEHGRCMECGKRIYGLFR